MNAIVEFLTNVSGPGEGEKIELRLRDEAGDMHTFFFKTPQKAVAFGRARAKDHEVYFGVAPRCGSGGRKEHVKRVSSVWIDFDRAPRQRLSTLMKKVDLFPLQPTYVVGTGGGLHVYWGLESVQPSEDVEAVLRGLRDHFLSDHVVDCTRVLRLPGTFNHKYKPKRPVEIIKGRPDRTYRLRDVATLAKANQKTCELLHGELRGYKSRSERDLAAMVAIVRAGGDQALVRYLFDNLAVGARYRERGGEDYLVRTFEKAQEFAGAIEEQEAEDPQMVFVEFEECYYVGTRAVSTFTLTPLSILEGRDEDSIVCDVHARGYKWSNVVFPRRAFTKSDAMQKHLPVVSWQWLGTDNDVRLLLVHLVDQLLEDGHVPKAKATTVLGRHGDLWVGSSSVLSIDEVYEPSTAPLAYVNVGREAPSVAYPMCSDATYEKLLRDLLTALVKINRPEVVLPSLAWFLATPQKPHIERLARFPILFAFGTRGSGKTSMIQEVFLRLVGYEQPRGYDCATTKFSALALMGSSNAIPISLVEFRADSYTGGRVQRLLRLAYDTGFDVRGRPDQTTVSYPLTSPVVLDGEDFVTDPATMERVVPVNLQPETIKPGTGAYDSFLEVASLPLCNFMGRYLQFCLAEADGLLENWRSYVLKAQSLCDLHVLPARIANNYAVLLYGLDLFQAFLTKFGLSIDLGPSHLKESLSFVFDASMGRTLLAVDQFVSDIINRVALKPDQAFAWRLDEDTDTLWIHLKSSHDWWLSEMRRRGEEIVGLRAIKHQLKERRAFGNSSSGQYAEAPETRNVGRQAYWMYPIDTAKASRVLDTPYPLELGQIIVRVKE